MNEPKPNSITIPERLEALRQAVTNRLSRPGATPADDSMNREILSHVEDAHRIAADYFTLFEPLHAHRKNMTLLQGDEARRSIRDFGGAAARLENLIALVDGADKDGLSPLFARKVSRDYAEITQIIDLINDSYVEGKLRIAGLEKAGPHLVLTPQQPKSS